MVDYGRADVTHPMGRLFCPEQWLGANVDQPMLAFQSRPVLFVFVSSANIEHLKAVLGAE